MKNKLLHRPFQGPDELTRTFRSARRQILLFQLLALGLVFGFTIDTLNQETLLFGGGLIVSTFVSLLFLRWVSHGEPYLVMIASMIFSIGIIMIYRIEPELGMRQLVIYLGSLVCFFFVYFIVRAGHRLFEGHEIFYYAVTVGLFLVTLAFGLTLGGARNWITVAGVRVQPSEFAKIPFVFFVASWYTHYERYQTSLVMKMSLSIAVYVLLALFMLQRELGTAAVFFVVLIASQAAFERNRWIPFLNIALACLGLFVAYHLFSHVRVRFDMWLNPWSDFNDKGYQIIQALFAIAEGGFFGTGIGLGQPTRIPLGHSDFIFASTIEEMGLFMGICLIFLFIILLYRGFKYAMQQERDFYAALAVCISTQFAAQALIMFAGVFKVIPLTGITVPFLTYGGSSLLSSFILLGALQACAENFTLEVRHETK